VLLLTMTRLIKNDDDKPMWHLLPLEEIEEIVKVMTYGAKKYSPHGWKEGDQIDCMQRYFSAAMRHIKESQKGNLYDEETGLNHLAHAACCVLFMLWHERNNYGPRGLCSGGSNLPTQEEM